MDVGATWTQGTGATLVAPVPSDRAIVLAGNLAGYRGGARISALSGGGGLPAVKCMEESRRHRAAARPPSIGGVTILAGGWYAQGDAGRMGGAPAHLLIVEPGEGLRAARYGRLYGRDPVLAWRWTGSEWTPEDPDPSAEGPPSASW